MGTLTLRDPRVTVSLIMSALAIGAISAASPFAAIFVVVAVAALALAWLDTAMYVVALVALTPFFDVGVVVVGPIDFKLLQFGWFLAIAVIGLRFLVGHPVPMKKVPVWALAMVAALVLWDAGAAQTSVVPVRSVVEVAQTAYLGTVLAVAAAVIGAFDDRNRLRLALAAAWSFLGIFALSAFWYYVLGASFPRMVLSAAGVSVTSGPLKVQAAGTASVTLERFGLINIGPVASAAVFVVVLTFAVAAMLDSRAVRYRLLSITVAAAAGMGLVLTYSRAGWLVGVIVLWLLSLRAGPRTMLVLTLALALLVVGAVMTQPAVAARMQEFTDLTEGSFAVHVRMWLTAIWMTATRPLTGWGPGAFREIAPGLGIGTEYWPWMAHQDTHNFVLQTSAESGLLGLAILLTLLFILLAKTLRPALRRGGLLAFAPWVAAFGVLLMDLTLNTFRTEITWITLAVLLATLQWNQSPGLTSEDVREV